MYPQLAYYSWQAIKSPYVVLGLCLVLASPLFFLRGIGVFDDSLYLKFGELIAGGALPYRDFFDNKPPGIYYVAAAIAWLGRGHWLAPRIFLFVFAVVFAGWVTSYTQKYWGAAAAYWTAWLFGLSYITSQGYSLHTDQFCAFFGFAGIVVVSGSRRNSFFAWLVAGVLVGIAFLFKQPAIIYLIAMALCQLAQMIGQKLLWRVALTRCAMLGTGFVTVLGVVITVTSWQGLGQTFYDAIVTNGLLLAKAPVNLRSAIGLWLKVPAVSLTLLSCAVLIESRSVRQSLRRNPNIAELVLLSLSGLLSLIPTLRTEGSHGHYAGAAVCFVSIGNAVVLANWMAQIGKWRGKKILKRFATATVSLLVLAYLAAILGGGAAIIREDRLRIDLAQMREIREVLSLKLPPGEPILCLSPLRAARLYYMSGRKPFAAYLFFWWNIDDKFSFADAVNMLLTSKVPGAIVEVPLQGSSAIEGKEITENDLQQLQSRYKVVELSNSVHPLYQTRTLILIRRDFQ